MLTQKIEYERNSADAMPLRTIATIPQVIKLLLDEGADVNAKR